MPPYSGTNGDDSYWGGADDDYIEGLGGSDYLLGNGGNDTILGGDGNDNLHGGDGNDVLDGGEGDDWLTGNDGIDTLLGMGGDDRFLVTPSSSIAGELIDGGDGVDTLQFDGIYISGPITLNMSDPAVPQDLAGATVINIEQLGFRGSAGNDVITGGVGDDFIDGFDGNDLIDGGSGDDTLDGGSGSDTVQGGSGDDNIRGGSGGTGDLLYGGGGNDVFFWNQDALIDGGAGIDQIRIEYYAAGIDLTVNLSDPTLETMVLGTRVIGVERLWMQAGSGNDRLTGGSGDDVLVGNAGNDILKGGDGNDNLSGGDGSDELYGGAGDDYLHCYPIYDLSPYDIINGGDGFDTLEYWAYNDTAAITIDLLATTGMVTNVEQILFTGGSGQNHVLGGVGSDRLWGGISNDYFDGRGGDDDIRSGDGNDVIIGDSGNDFLDGGNGGDSISGGDGNDLLQGGGGNDSLNGGTGDDELFAGDGTNTQTGGSGSDLFYGSVADLSGDTITDFGVGDRIVITDATLANFTFTRSGTTLNYTGGSLTLSAAISGTIVASAASGGGVQLTIQAAITNDARNDFNGDGRSDILWGNVGDVSAFNNWLGQANGGLSNNSANFTAYLGAGWQAFGIGDFNGDGRDDVLWGTSGPDASLFTNWLGQANGGLTDNSANMYTFLGAGWEVAGIGDFNGDGRDDVLWGKAGNVSVFTNWLGQANGGLSDNSANMFAYLGSGWKVVGTGDFNGDGRDDILWGNSGPNASLFTNWLGQANGGLVDNSANMYTFLGPEWHVAATGDFNGDGRDDILWARDGGAFTNWLGQTNGGFVDNSANFFAFLGAGWQVAGVGDYNGDGRDDILWRNSSGDFTNWLGQANGGFVDNSANFWANPGAGWNVQPDLLL